jgi:hypothetical protein
MPGKMPDQTLDQSVRITRGAGSGQHLASVLQENRENANIDADLGFIWRISDYTTRFRTTFSNAGRAASGLFRLMWRRKLSSS